RKKELGQSVSSIGSEDLDQFSITTVDEALEGRIAGLVTSSTGGQVGSSSPIRIRGTVSLSQSNDPLIYLNGVRIRQNRSDFINVSTAPLDMLDTDNIASIEVLKGASAATLYGTEASSGVLLIETKTGK